MPLLNQPENNMGMRYKGDALNRISALRNRFNLLIRTLENEKELSRAEMLGALGSVDRELEALYERIEIEQDENTF